MKQGPVRLAAAVAVVALAGCGGTATGTTDGSTGTSTGAATAPPIAEVDPVDDPKAWTGGSSVALPEEPVEPVTDSPEQRLPATVTDHQGTEVTVEDTNRILALDLNGTLSRTVFELGLGKQVVGRDVSSTFPDIADRPVVTHNGHELNAEAILELDPTVLLTDTSLGPWDVVLQVREAGIPVVVVDPERSLEGVVPLIEQVAAALGVPEAGRQLARRVGAEVDDVRAAIDAVAPDTVQEKLRTVFLYARGQSGVYYMLGGGSGADSLIEAIGGYDVSAEIGWDGMKPLNDEGLVAAQPELVLMMSKGLESVGGVDGLLERFPALAQTPAGKNRRVVDMPDGQILGFGPRTAAVLNALAVAIYAPDAL